MKNYLQLTEDLCQEHSGKRLDVVLAKLFSNYSRTCIKKWIINRQVSLNGIIIDEPRKKINGHEKILINIVPQKKIYLQPQKIPLNIIYEDDTILVINKPANLVIHPGIRNEEGTLLNGLLHYYPKIANIPRCGIVHRLDKDTTGVMVVAKTLLAQNYLIKKLRLHQVTREYEAILIGRMISGGRIAQPIKTCYSNKGAYVTVHPLGKLAITNYRIVEHLGKYTRVRIRLETGRTHQIRVHMAYINHPIVGDPLYGRGKYYNINPMISNQLNNVLKEFNRQALHAIQLSFNHPTTNINMQYNAPLPMDMINLINAIKYDGQTEEISHT